MSTVAMLVAIVVSRVLMAVRSARKRTGSRRAAGSEAARRRCGRIRSSVRPWASVHGASRSLEQEAVPDSAASFYRLKAYFCPQSTPIPNPDSNPTATNPNAANRSG